MLWLFSHFPEQKCMRFSALLEYIFPVPGGISVLQNEHFIGHHFV